MIATESRQVEAGTTQADMVGHWPMDRWELEATLPYPAGGVNRLYRSDRGRVHKSAAARQWQWQALGILEAAGLRPSGEWCIRLDYELFACRGGLDLDSPIKAVVDVVAAGCRVDDRHLTELRGWLHRVKHRREQRLRVRVIVTGTCQ
jgi:hypothetical protein